MPSIGHLNAPISDPPALFGWRLLIFLPWNFREASMWCFHSKQLYGNWLMCQTIGGETCYIGRSHNTMQPIELFDEAVINIHEPCRSFQIANSINALTQMASRWFFLLAGHFFVAFYAEYSIFRTLLCNCERRLTWSPSCYFAVMRHFFARTFHPYSAYVLCSLHSV